MADVPLRGLVLSGGGARGAYEAGVLAYIFKELPAHCKGRIRVMCGTSVGGIHGCFLAANAHKPQYRIDTLLDVWRNLQLEKLLRLSATDMMRLPFDVRAMFKKQDESKGILLNSHLLQHIVTRDIAWPKIQTNMQSGLLDALTISTTHIATGKTFVFIHKHDGSLPAWTRDLQRVAVAVPIGPKHALASAAIPVLFPAINIDGAYYCDGGLRQNTPLSPALRLGANRVLVIAVGHGGIVEHPPAQPQVEEDYPGPSLLIGKILNALLLDHLDYDLAQLQGINRLIEDGQRAFGPTFVEELSKSAISVRGVRYRHVDTLVIRPSRDLAQMASEHVLSGDIKLSGLAHWFFRKMANDTLDHHSDLLSYVCFDSCFAKSLIDLGMHDADAQRAKLIEFFDET